MALNTAKLYDTSGSSFSFRAALVKPFLSVFALLMTWQARASMRKRLQELDENNLIDMGISRAEAKFEADKPFFWRS